ncbi:MAG: hypothetical protein KBT57_06310, partial [bacterium]|nr:hypothetical protein [Candidatus Limimorpha equi]
YTYPIEISGNKTLTAGIMYGKEVAGVEFVAPVPEGALKGKFSVSATKQVYFSIGNLQYHPKNNKWRFAESQEDVCDKTSGLHNAVGYSQNSDTWIDLFGWGTSNYDHNDSGCHPWNTSNTNSNYYPYGTTWGNDLNSSTGMADWGKANATDLGEGWYTLSYSDWYYMLFTRKIKGLSGVGKTFARATIQDANGQNLYGLVIFPDDYSGSQSSPLSSIPEGCAFLPCAGHRGKTNVNGYLTSGHYWTSTHHNSKENYAWNLAISSNQDYVTEFRPNSISSGSKITEGQSVRLVHDVPAAN